MKRLSVCICVLSTSFLAGCAGAVPGTPGATSGPLKVVATFYPLAEFSRAVGNGYVDVTTITPAGAEPHDYEPTAQDIGRVQSAAVFLANGGGVDTWADKADTGNARVLRVQNFLPLDTATGTANESPLDPHVWLDPVLAQTIVTHIRDALTAADPAHVADYEKNATAYTHELQALDTAYKTGLATCGIKSIISSHNAFHYMAKRYGFQLISISGLSPDSEPSAKELAATADTARTNNIRYIFFETLVSPKLAQTIAKEVGADTLVLNPLEGLTSEDIRAGKNYLSIMRENLHNLRTAMQCQ
ncbi:MAG: zinc transporter substrate-binding protein [Candidatus Peribacteria bacterium]|nr:zinc transporter substrate-binding protein [Candidatus Peribacteria bacterium]